MGCAREKVEIPIDNVHSCLVSCASGKDSQDTGRSGGLHSILVIDKRHYHVYRLKRQWFSGKIQLCHPYDVAVPGVRFPLGAYLLQFIFERRAYLWHVRPPR